MTGIARQAKSAGKADQAARTPQLFAVLGTAALSLVAASLAGSARAAEPGHSLSLTGPSAAQVGATSTLQASGTVPDGVLLNRYVNVYAIPTAVTSACPAEFTNAMQLAYASSAQGGDTVANHVQVDGAFSVPIAYAPRAAGTFLLCGYLHEGVETMASAPALAVSVPGQGTAGPRPTTAPTNTSKPVIRRAPAKLVCRKGAWSGNPSSYSYQWRVNGKKKAGATKRTLPVTRSLKGKRVKCGVTARNAAGAATAFSRAHRVR